jgi:hypothetical protein
VRCVRQTSVVVGDRIQHVHDTALLVKVMSIYVAWFYEHELTAESRGHGYRRPACGHSCEALDSRRGLEGAAAAVGRKKAVRKLRFDKHKP